MKTYDVTLPWTKYVEAMSWAITRYGGGYFEGHALFKQDQDNQVTTYRFFDKKDATDFKLRFGGL